MALARGRRLRGGIDYWPGFVDALSTMLLAFVFLTGALRTGVPLGVAYGVWTAAGVALTAIFSRLIHQEPMTPLMIAGIGMIGAGVLLIELGAGQ